MNKLLLSAHEASELLGISKSSLHRLTDAGKLQSKKITSRRVGWLYTDLVKFCENLPDTKPKQRRAISISIKNAQNISEAITEVKP